MANFVECHNCDHSKTCAQTPKACEDTEAWTTSPTCALVKAAQAVLESPFGADLYFRILELKYALIPFQEEQQ